MKFVRRMFADLPLRTILIASFVVLTTVAVAMTGYVSFSNGREAVNQVVSQLRSDISIQIRNDLTSQLSTPELINRINASVIGQGLLDVNDGNAMEHFFWNQVGQFESVSSIYFGNTQGGLANAGREGAGGFRYVIGTDDFIRGPFRKFATDAQGRRGELLLTVPDFDARERPWYLGAQDSGESAWSDIYVLFTGHDLAITASTPVYDAERGFLGVAATDLALSQLGDNLQQMSIGKSGEAYVLDPSGLLVAASTGEPLFTIADDGRWRRLPANQSTNPLTLTAVNTFVEQFGALDAIGDDIAYELRLEGERYFAQFSPLNHPGGLDWYTLVVIPESDFLAQFYTNARWTLMLVLLTLAFAIAAGVAGSRALTRPLVRLNAAARALSSDQVLQPVRPGHIREINELSTSFNTMACKLNETLAGLRSEVAEREAVESRLRRSEVRYRSVVESLSEVVFQTDESGRWTFLNTAWFDLTGHKVDETIGNIFLDYVHVEDREHEHEQFLMLIRQQREDHRSTVRMVHKDNSTRWIEVYAHRSIDEAGATSGTSGILRDVTERLQGELALRRMQKMEAIGRLSGGIAHDFNNMLAIILGNLDLLDRKLVDDEKARKWVESIRKSAQRAENLTRQLLGFSRRQATETRVTDINRLIHDMESLIARSITPRIEFQLDLSTDLSFTRIDSGDFEDALLNLVINARDAMPDGGKLAIQTRNRILDEDFVDANPAAQAGEYVEIAVSDTGVGVSGEHLERIFEPFFSTKSRDKGTGLGLAMVYGFVKRSNGYVKVDSEVNRGTRISVYLPRADGVLEAIKKFDDSSDEIPGGTESILIVDDEQALCELTSDLMSELGYQVRTASNGSDALTCIAEHSDIQLLFSDVVMPGPLNGYDLAEAATQIRPSLKILLTSGYTEPDDAGDHKTQRWGQLLRKPYSPMELARRLRALLDGSGA